MRIAFDATVSGRVRTGVGVYARHLHAALQLKQLDLEVHCRREVRLRLLETTQFDDLARLGPSGRWNGWDGWFLCHLS